MSIFTGPFWRATLERSIKTAAQTAAASGIIGATAFDVDWLGVLSIAAAAAVLSVLTSIGTAAATDGSPSAGGGENLESYTLSTGVITAYNGTGRDEPLDPAVEAAGADPEDYTGKHRPA